MELREETNRSPELIRALLAVWERSVRATHRFLTDGEIRRIAGYVPEALRTVPVLVTAWDGDEPVGFMGIDGPSLEMLFVAGEHRGRGIGGRLLRTGIGLYGVKQLTVNEQNPEALAFYRHLGFAVYRRSDRDEQGGPYPLLYLRREE